MNRTLLYTGSMPRSVFMQIMHENHEFACAKINAIDFVCINCCWNEVRVNQCHLVSVMYLKWLDF